jgi:ABC-type phosphate transport system substrate-binding protein
MPASRYKRGIRTLLLAIGGMAGDVNAQDGVLVIGHANVARIDVAMVERIYNGRATEVGGIAIKPVHVESGSAVRDRFLRVYLKKDEQTYTAYWTVRRYSGMGPPPRELKSGADVINFVKSTPGAIGYIDEADLQPGINVLLKK